MRVTALTGGEPLPSQESKRKKYLSRLRLDADEREIGVYKIVHINSEFLLTLILYSRFILVSFYSFIFLRVYILTHLLFYIYISISPRNSDFPSTNNFTKLLNTYSVA